MNISPISHSFTSYSNSLANLPAEEDLVKPGLKEANEEAVEEAVEELSLEDQKKVEELQARDAEVRAHEMAHLAAAGSLAVSGANFGYERGPDGENYAVEGEVKIDVSEGNTPEETLRRAKTIYAAALAPAEPSAQDRNIAAQAVEMEAKARAELVEQKNTAAKEEQSAKAKPTPPTEEEPTQPLLPAIKSYLDIFNNQPQPEGFFVAV